MLHKKLGFQVHIFFFPAFLPPDLSLINPHMEMNILPLMLSTAQDGAFDSVTPPTTLKCRRKKRTKLIEIDNSLTPSTGVIISKPKYVKPDPSAPKITRPCTECGKRFWSWKALFGHMRCHPERQWRGINPPPNLRRPESDTTITESEAEEASAMTEEDHEVAKFLLLLANGRPSAASDSPSVTSACIVSQGLMMEYSDAAVVDLSENVNVNCRSECLSCKKVFGSRQALGGHRASHKNIKGCYAITKNEEGIEENCINEFREIGSESEVKEHSGREDEITLMDIGGGGHKCSVCFRVFSSGQALGGHMRCHWEKMVDDDARAAKDGTADGGGRCGMNLKLPAASVEDEAYYSANSSGIVLDLRLRL